MDAPLHPRRGLLGLGAVLLAACGGGDDADAVRTLDRVEVQLVSLPELFEPQEDAELRFGFVQPAASATVSEPLPSLVLMPGEMVILRVPDVPPGTRMEFAVGIDDPSYDKGQGAARFLVGDHASGRVLFDGERRAGARTPRGERTWVRGSVDVNAGQELSLEVEFDGTGGQGMACGFGLLELVRPVPVPIRTADSPGNNVVLVVVDTLRADALGVYGDTRGTTPILDALAEQGLVFESAYAPSSWTFPSTATLLTGLTPPEHGVRSKNSGYLSESLDTLAEVFAADGWICGAFSTNPLITPAKNFDQGFTSFEDDTWGKGGVVVDRALEWISGHADERFFLYLHLSDPHTPYTPARDLVERFAPHLLEDGLGIEGETLQEFMKRHGGAPTADQRRAFVSRTQDLYACEVAGMDRAVGRLMTELDGMGLADRTVLALTSDHGEEFFEHGTYGHGKNLYEETLRVPLLFHGPGVPSGVRHPDLVEIRSLPRTLVELAGVETRVALQGRELLDVVRRGEESRRPLFFETQNGHWVDLETQSVLRYPATLHGVQIGGERFVWANADGRADESTGEDFATLFDLEQDPGERRDLTGGRPDDVERYKQMILRWLSDSEDVRPQPFTGDRDTVELMRAMGYIGDDDH